MSRNSSRKSKITEFSNNIFIDGCLQFKINAQQKLIYCSSDSITSARERIIKRAHNTLRLELHVDCVIRQVRLLPNTCCIVKKQELFLPSEIFKIF